MTARYDLAVVGAGIVGLAHALAASRRGLRVAVIDRDSRANGASIRNFGFITVTGQSAQTWARAFVTRRIWEELAPQAGIPIVHRNECVIVHSPEALAVLEEFVATHMGAGCELLAAREAAKRVPMARPKDVSGALWSPHELRVEPRTAIPALTAYLEKRWSVTFQRSAAVRAVSGTAVETTNGTIHAERVVVAPGPDLVTLFPEVHAQHGVRLCKLQMLRLAPQPPSWRLPASIMSDFALVRYKGFSAQPAAAVLRKNLEKAEPWIFEYGIHLIVVQSEDGSLVIGDSHDYGTTPDPFYSREIEEAILQVAHRVLDIPNREVVERWIGIYPQAEQCEPGWTIERLSGMR